MAIDTVFGQSFGDLSGQIAARRNLAANNFFQTLSSNRQALGQLADARQRDLANTLAVAGMMNQAREARKRQALYEGQNRQELGLALMRERGLNRRAQEEQMARLIGQGQARADREQNILRDTEEANRALALNLVQKQAVDPEEIPIPLSPESKQLLKVNFDELKRGETEGNKLAQSLSDSLNAYLGQHRKAKDALIGIYENEDLDRTEFRDKVRKALADTGVRMEVVPYSRDSLPNEIAKMMDAARTTALKRAGDWASYDEETGEFTPILSTRFNKAKAGKQAVPTVLQPPSARETPTPNARGGGIMSPTPELRGEDEIGAELTAVFRSRGLGLKDAAAMARNIVRNPDMLERYSRMFQGGASTNVPPVLTERTGNFLPPPTQ